MLPTGARRTGSCPRALLETRGPAETPAPLLEKGDALSEKVHPPAETTRSLIESLAHHLETTAHGLDSFPYRKEDIAYASEIRQHRRGGYFIASEAKLLHYTRHAT